MSESKPIIEFPLHLPPELGSKFSAIGWEITIVLLLVVYNQLVNPLMTQIRDKLSNPRGFNSEVYSLLSQLLAKSGADRVCLALTHNGQKFVNGLHYNKLSVTHEVLLPGVSGVSRQVRDIPLSKIEREITDCIAAQEQGIPYTCITTSAVTAEGCKQHLLSIGCRTMLNHLIIVNHQVPDGMLSLQFSREELSDQEYQEILSSREINNLTSLVSRLVSKRRSPIVDKIMETMRRKT